MRKFFSISIIILMLFNFSGCGSFSDSYKSASVDRMSLMNSTTDNAAFVTGGDYSNTYIEGDKTDYSYSFTAGGNTNKDRKAILDDYEHIQDIVTQNGGFIEDLNNEYTTYPMNELDSWSRGLDYKAVGTLGFTIQIENENVQTVLDELEDLCVRNQFTVSSYNQYIHNYKNYKIVDEMDDDYYSDVITSEELERRTKYADISVTLHYYVPRSKIVSLLLNLKFAIKDILDNCSEIISVIFVICVIALCLFSLSILFYKSFKKMVFKHRIKHPEYYLPKEVSIISTEEEK